MASSALRSPKATGRPIRVLVVDDSMVIRTLVSSWIGAEPGFELAGVARDGAEAVSVLGGVEADVCILDLEMPGMGGIEAIPRLLRLRPELKILVASRLVQRGPEAGLKAIEAGAADYIAKPSTNDVGGTDAFRREILARARSLAVANPPPRSGAAAPSPAPARPRLAQRSGPVPAPEVVVVAASTGGPPVLQELLKSLPGGLAQPILIVQHMPAAFIDLLAVQLSKASAIPVSVAREGEALTAGGVWLAPGDQHLRVEKREGRLYVRLDQSPPENFCRPAADVLFRSAAKACGAHVVAVVLTGMGRDGLAGASAISAAGGVILAQDEGSSVVWGMPGAVVGSGLVSVVGPVGRLATAVRRLSHGEEP